MKKRIILGLLFIVVAAAAMAAPAIAASAAPVEVSSWTQLRSVLSDSTTTEILLTADITMGSGGATINPNKTSLTIDGGYGFLGIEKRKFTDYSSNSANDTIRLTSSGRLSEIIVKNLDVTGSNNYGLIYNNGYSVPITFDGVNYTGPELAYWRNGKVTINNSLVVIIPGRNLAGGEAVRATNIVLSGIVAIVKVHPTAAADLFYIDNRYGGVTVAPNANVSVNNNRVSDADIATYYPGAPRITSYTERSGFMYCYAPGYFTVGEGATFTYEGRNYFNIGKDLGEITFAEGSTVKIETYGNFPSCGYGMINATGNMRAGRSSYVTIDAYSNGRVYPTLLLTGVLTVDSPRFFHIANALSGGCNKSLAVGSECGAFSYNFTNISSLRYRYVTGANTYWKNPDASAFSVHCTMKCCNLMLAATSSGYRGSPAYNVVTACLRSTNLVECEGDLVKVTYRYVDKDLPGNPQLPGAAYNDVVTYVFRGTSVNPMSPPNFKGNVIYRTGSTLVDYEFDSVNPSTTFTASGDTVVTYYYRKAFYATVHYVDRADTGTPRADISTPVSVKVLRGDQFMIDSSYVKDIPPYMMVDSRIPYSSGPITSDGQRFDIEYAAARRMELVYINVGKDPGDDGYVLRTIDTGVIVEYGGTFDYVVSDVAFTVGNTDPLKYADYEIVGSNVIHEENVTESVVEVPFRRMLRIYATFYDRDYGPSARLDYVLRIDGALEYSKTPSPYTLTLTEAQRRFTVGGVSYHVPAGSYTQTLSPLYSPAAFEDNLVFSFPAVRYYIYTVEFRNVNEPDDPPFLVIEYEYEYGDSGYIDATGSFPDPYLWDYVYGISVRDYGTITGEQPGGPMIIYFTEHV